MSNVFYNLEIARNPTKTCFLALESTQIDFQTINASGHQKFLYHYFYKISSIGNQLSQLENWLAFLKNWLAQSENWLAQSVSQMGY